MEFGVWQALVAGLVGTIVMSAMVRMAGSAGMTRMPPFPLVTGSMMTAHEERAKMIGTVIHYLVMGTVVFGLVYAALFTAFGSSAWWLGILIGVVHGVVVGVMAMSMMPAVHPRMGPEPEPVSTGGGTATKVRGEVRLSAPGLMGVQWGTMTPVGVLAGHAVYGLVVALVYGWLL